MAEVGSPEIEEANFAVWSRPRIGRTWRYLLITLHFLEPFDLMYYILYYFIIYLRCSQLQLKSVHIILVILESLRLPELLCSCRWTSMGRNAERQRYCWMVGGSCESVG